MKNKLSTALIFLGLLFSSKSYSQDLHIYYDVYRDTSWFLQDDKPVKIPKVHRDGLIQLHLVELNTYRYTVGAAVEQSNSSSLTGSMSIAGGLWTGAAEGGEPAGSSFLGMLGSLAFPGLGMSFAGGEGGMISTLLGGTRGGLEAALLEQTDATLQEMTRTEAEIQDLCLQLRATSRMLSVSSFMRKQLDDLLYNASLPPSEIKRISEEYFRAMFGTTVGPALSLESALAWTERSNELNRQAVQLQQMKTKWSALNTRFGNQIRELRRLNLNEPAFVDAVDAFQHASKQNTALDEDLANVLDAIREVQAAAATFSPEELANLHLRQMELRSNSFSFHETFYPVGENMDLVVTINHTDTMLHRLGLEESNPVRVRTFRIRSYGGLKITASAGINFASFSEQPQKYSTRDGLITAEDDDQFLPAISSLIHFYPNRGGKMAIGGSFGVGLPILSGDQAQSAMFFLGPSLIFGQSQRVVLNAGMLGGRTARLGKGYAIGDAFDTDLGDIPVSSRYEYGFFLGLSFNLMGN